MNVEALRKDSKLIVHASSAAQKAAEWVQGIRPEPSKGGTQ